MSDWEEDYLVSKIKDDLVRSTRKKYVEQTMEISFLAVTMVVMGYLMYWVFQIAFKPAVLLSSELIMNQVKFLLGIWIVAAVASIALSYPIGRKWAENVLKKSMEEYSKKSLKRKLLIQRYRTERGADIKVKEGFLYVVGLKPLRHLMGADVEEQLKDLDGAIKELMDSFSALRYEIISFDVEVEDPSQVEKVRKWAIKLLRDRDLPELRIAKEKDGLITVNMILSL